MPAVSQVLTGSRTIVEGDGLTIDITISSVTTSRSIVMHTVRSADIQGRMQRHTFAAHLTSSTNLRLQRYESSYAVTAYVEWTVVEFESGALANLQSGLITPTTNQTDTTITAVDTDAAFPILTRYNDAGQPGAEAQGCLPSFVQTSVPGDTLRLKFGGTYTPTSGVGFRFQIVEFDAADAAVQSGTIDEDSYSSTATITSVDLGASLLVGFGTKGGDASRGITLFKFNSSTELFAGRQEYGSTVQGKVGWFVVEMLDNSVVKAGSSSIANSSTAPASQPSWTGALTDGAVFHPSSVPYLQFVASNDDGVPGDFQLTITLDSPQDSVTAQRYGSTNQVDFYWQVIDWKSAAGVTIPTLSLPGVQDITANTARPKVTLTW